MRGPLLCSIGIACVMTVLSAVHSAAVRDRGQQTLLALCLLHTDDFGIERILSSAIDTSQASERDSSLEVVCALQDVGDECVEDDTEDSRI